MPMEDLKSGSKWAVATRTMTLSKAAGSYTYFRNGDVLLPKISPCFENGKLGIAKDLVNGVGFGSSEYIVMRPNDSALGEWLYYYLSRAELRDEGTRLTYGTVGQRRIPKEFVEGYPIPIPSIAEQRRIVAILDAAFEHIAIATANADNNLKNARAIFESYLDFVLTHRGEGWTEKPLEELGTITSSKRIFKSEYVESGVPFYRTKEIKELANGRGIGTELFISRKRYDEIRERFGVPKAGDVLVTAIGTIGESWVVDGDTEFYFKDGNVLWLRDFDAVNPRFLKYVLASFVESINQMARGSAYSALPINRLKTYRVFLPPLVEQAEVVARLDALRDDVRQLESIYKRKLDALDALKKSLLNAAFSGDL